MADAEDAALKRTRAQSSSTDHDPQPSAKKRRSNPDDGDDKIGVYLQNFPTSPAGTVKKWVASESAVGSAVEKLAKLFQEYKSDANGKDLTKEALEKADKIISDLKKDSGIVNIDMELDWSHLEEKLSEFESYKDLEALGRFDAWHDDAGVCLFLCSLTLFVYFHRRLSFAPRYTPTDHLEKEQIGTRVWRP